jgi:hypothetical protein
VVLLDECDDMLAAKGVNIVYKTTSREFAMIDFYKVIKNFRGVVGFTGTLSDGALQQAPESCFIKIPSLR